VQVLPSFSGGNYGQRIEQGAAENAAKASRPQPTNHRRSSASGRFRNLLTVISQ
jgi:hypothetical protein